MVGPSGRRFSTSKRRDLTAQRQREPLRATRPGRVDCPPPPEGVPTRKVPRPAPLRAGRPVSRSTPRRPSAPPATAPLRLGASGCGLVSRRMADYETVDLEVRDGVAHLTLNRPDAANGINLPLARDLMDAALAIAADPAARVVLLTGAGARFCGGGDLKGFAGRDDLPTHLREILGPLHVAIAELVRGDAPVVAAVQGSAAGAGIGLVGASDLVVAGESAEVRDGLHRRRSHPRRLVELVPAPARRSPAGAGAHVHQPRAVGGRGAGRGGSSRRWCPTTSSPPRPRRSPPGWPRVQRRRWRRPSGCSTPASKRRSSRTWRVRPRRSRRASGTAEGAEGIAVVRGEARAGLQPRLSLASFSRTRGVERGAVVVELRPQRRRRPRRGCAPRAARRCAPSHADRRDRDAVGHLHDRQQGVEPVELLQRHRYTDHGQRRHRRGHAREVRGTARAGDDHPQAAVGGACARTRTSRRACGAPRRRAPRARTPNSVSTSTAPCITGQVGVAAHDHADERRVVAGHVDEPSGRIRRGRSPRRGRTRTCAAPAPRSRPSASSRASRAPWSRRP